MSSPSLPPDKIIITDLSLPVTISNDHWSRALPQPHVLNLTIIHPTAVSGATDTLPTTINYSTATKAVTKHVQDRTWASLEECAEETADVLRGLGAGRVGVQIAATKVLAGGWVEIQIWRGGHGDEQDTFKIREIPVRCIIGINPQERLEKQTVVVDLEVPLPSPASSLSSSTGFPHKILSDAVHDFMTPTSYQTIESATANLATHLLSLPIPTTYPHPSIPSITVRISKPYALTFAKYASVEITRSLASSSLRDASDPVGEHVAFLALGSNIGDSVGNITRAIEMIESESEGKAKLVGTSFLYESEPMYVEDQDKFVNGACKITTSLAPLEVLRLLKRIEAAVGRTVTFRNGPRVVDLDLVFYDSESIDIESSEGGLIVPHARLSEREFVLRPLADLILTFQHPTLPSSISTLLSLLPPPTQLTRLLPFRPSPLTSSPRMLIMSILNLTPDSFSDGGSYTTSAALLTAAKQHIADGANILDVGGMSTRPGAEEVPEEEETRRVVEGIKTLREGGITAPVSVDTYRASVAKAAIDAGANAINDVRAGAEPGMLAVMAEASCPVILMHSRGTPKTMVGLAPSQETDILEIVRTELKESVQAAIAAGVKKWNIVLDPGLGFAKTASQSLAVLSRLEELVAPGSGLEGYPVLVGGSRKRFVGEVTGVEVPKDRVSGSLGVVGACFRGEKVTSVVRVHDTRETRELIDVLEAVGRGSV